MAFEPFSFGDRWYDKIGRGTVSLRTFAILCAVVVVVLIGSHLL